MLLLVFILLGYAFCNQTPILKCDFETSCIDFIVDYNWGLTDGNNPHPLNHDHTLNTSSGHYLYYIPKSTPPFDQIKAEIKTKDWVQLPTDEGVCFRMWYYTPRINLPFSIQIVQGDDEELIRIIDTIPGKDPTTNDWALINVPLPAEKIKLYIRLNTSGVPLAFDDISIDYCNESHPLPPETLYECDFESSCIDDFISLSNYPYQWSIMKAEDAIKIENKAPSVDFTFGNQSGHYALVPNSKIIQKGNVGYLALQKSFNITSNESFCLNFQYYSYGNYYSSHLNIFALLLNASEIVQSIWPPIYRQFPYTRDKWTWGIVNLPVGYYSLLFQVDNTDTGTNSFALDNISVISCDYPSSIFVDDGAYLSISCNFDDLTMCVMQNDDGSFQTTYNFTVLTGDTVPNNTLGPLQDHTNNSASGGFMYWNQHLPYISGANGVVYSPKPMQSNLGMCIQFAYYVKSSIDNQNGTTISLLTGGCLGSQLWSRALDDSHGWQVVTIPAPNVACMITYYFWASQKQLVPVSVAFDDIVIEQCNTFPSTTTTVISTSTTTTTTISTSTSTITTTDTTTSTQTITTTSSSSTSTIISTTSVLSTSTTPRNNSRRLLSFSGYYMIIIYFLLTII